MKNRHIISYVLFILGLCFCWRSASPAGAGCRRAVGLCLAIVGVIFYRRGK